MIAKESIALLLEPNVPETDHAVIRGGHVLGTKGDELTKVEMDGNDVIAGEMRQGSV